MAAWRQHICCTREAPDRRQCPRGFLGVKLFQTRLPVALLAALHGTLQHCKLLWKENLSHFMCSQAACSLLQSKTAEHKEHFGTYQDPRSKNEWEKAGDLR